MNQHSQRITLSNGLMVSRSTEISVVQTVFFITLIASVSETWIWSGWSADVVRYVTYM